MFVGDKFMKNIIFLAILMLFLCTAAHADTYKSYDFDTGEYKVHKVKKRHDGSYKAVDMSDGSVKVIKKTGPRTWKSVDYGQRGKVKVYRSDESVPPFWDD